jgi:hypothetical protein
MMISSLLLYLHLIRLIQIFLLIRVDLLGSSFSGQFVLRRLVCFRVERCIRRKFETMERLDSNMWFLLSVSILMLLSKLALRLI